MVSKWKLKKIDDLKSDEQGAIAVGPFGSKLKSSSYVEHGIPVIRGKNISENANFIGDFVYITKEKAKSLGSSNVHKDDLIFPHRGSIGEVGIISDENHYVISSSLMKLSCNKNLVIPKYLYYFFKSHLGRFELLKNASQVGTPGIGQPLASLKSIKVSLPPLIEQNKIVHFLNSLDSKIETNKKINQNLEGIAHTLFKSWFVDYDPVKAKAEKQKPKGTNTKLNKLFPDSFEDSEIGLIPKDWKVKSLDTVAHYQNGLALQKFRPETGEDSYPVLKISQLKKGYADGSEKASTRIKPECIVYDGDVIFSWSGSLVVDIWCGGTVALNQHLFKVTSVDYPKWFYYLYTKHHLEEFQRIAEAKAVTMGHIKREHLRQALCAIPPEPLLAEATNIITGLIEKQIQARMENKILANIRDSFLPKFLSGEIQIPELKNHEDKVA